MDGLERLRAKFTVDLHPSKLASAQEGVRAHLSSLLLRYNEDLGGVLLAWRGARLLTGAAAPIHPYFPYVRLEVVADVVVFRPRAGMRLVGTVNKVGADHLGLLVLGFINVALPAAAVRPELRPRLAEQRWVSTRDAKHVLELGTKVHFDVTLVKHHGQFVSLLGALQHPSTGADGFAQPPPDRARGGGQRQQAAPAQRQGQQQEQEQQAGGKKKSKERKEKRRDKAAAADGQQQQHAAPPAAAAQQQQQQHAAGQPAGGKKAKKAKQQQQQQQQNGGAAAQAPAAAPAAAAAAAGSGKKEAKEKKRDKKRKVPEAEAPAPAAPAAAAAAAGGAQQQHKEKKKKKKRTE